MYQRLLMAILFGFLAFGPAVAQESASIYEPSLAKIPPKPDMRPAKSFLLKGVLVSGSSRTALVNGQPVQEGDRVGGAEILSIEQRGIRVLVGARELAIDVGGTFVAEESPNDIARVSRIGVHHRHAVKFGETLSGIALRYRKGGATMDQMMIAMYQSNPQAFGRNINVLHEGAVLRIPDENELHHLTPAMAAAEVARHSNRQQLASPQPVKVAASSPASQYGPVERGDTLSAIASRVLHDGVTMDQMMIALYQSNPQAFSNNINVLYEGAILRIPDKNELHRQTPVTATAEVLRQTKAWQAGVEQHALLTLDHSNIMASADGPGD